MSLESKRLGARVHSLFNAGKYRDALAVAEQQQKLLKGAVPARPALPAQPALLAYSAPLPPPPPSTPSPTTTHPPPSTTHHTSHHLHPPTLSTSLHPPDRSRGFQRLTCPPAADAYGSNHHEFATAMNNVATLYQARLSAPRTSFAHHTTPSLPTHGTRCVRGPDSSCALSAGCAEVPRCRTARVALCRHSEGTTKQNHFCLRLPRSSSARSAMTTHTRCHRQRRGKWGWVSGGG